MRYGYFTLGAFGLAMLIAVNYYLSIVERTSSAAPVDVSKFPVGLTIGIKDAVSGQGVQSGMGPPGAGTASGWMNVGDWIKTAKTERLNISYDVIATANGEPTSIMAHFAFDNAGAVTQIDHVLQVLDMRVAELPLSYQVSEKLKARMVWTKLDDRFQGIAYLINCKYTL